MNICRKSLYILILVLILLVSIPDTSYPHHTKAVDKEAGFVEKAEGAIGRKIGDYTFIDQDGERFRLRDVIGEPLIISFIYTECTYTCPIITSQLATIINKASREFGNGFQVITIGFDVEHDTPQRMMEYGLRFTKNFDRWHFLSGDINTIRAITKELGFYYTKSGDEFVHLNMLTIIDRDGRVYKNIYGQRFRYKDISSAFKQILSGKRAAATTTTSRGWSLIGSIKLLCSRYNPATGRYEFYYPYFIVMVTQGITLIAIFVFLWGRDLSNLLSRFFRFFVT